MDFNKMQKEYYEGKLSQTQAKEFLEFLEGKKAEDMLSQEIIQLWTNKIKEGDFAIDSNELWEKINLKKESYSAAP